VEHSTVAASANELQFITPEEFMLSMNADDLNQAVRRIVGRPLKIKIVAGQSAASLRPRRRQKHKSARERDFGARTGQSGSAEIPRGIRRANSNGSHLKE